MRRSLHEGPVDMHDLGLADDDIGQDHSFHRRILHAVTRELIRAAFGTRHQCHLDADKQSDSRIGRR